MRIPLMQTKPRKVSLKERTFLTYRAEIFPMQAATSHNALSSPWQGRPSMFLISQPCRARFPTLHSLRSVALKTTLSSFSAKLSKPQRFRKLLAERQSL